MGTMYRHNSGLEALHAAISAVATTTVLLGDKGDGSRHPSLAKKRGCATRRTTRRTCPT